MFNYALSPRTERAPLVRGSSVTDGVKCGTQPTHISLYITVNVFCLRAKFLRLSCSTFYIVSISDLAYQGKCALDKLNPKGYLVYKSNKE